MGLSVGGFCWWGAGEVAELVVVTVAVAAIVAAVVAVVVVVVEIEVEVEVAVVAFALALELIECVRGRYAVRGTGGGRTVIFGASGIEAMEEMGRVGGLDCR